MKHVIWTNYYKESNKKSTLKKNALYSFGY